MKIFWKKLHYGRDFSIIAAGDDAVRGLRFHRKGKQWTLKSFIVENIGEDEPDTAYKKIFREFGKAELVVLTGKVEGTSFFRFMSADMNSAAQRGAVEFELSRQLLKVPENRQLQFCPSGKIAGDPNGIWVNTAVFPQRELDAFCRKLHKNGILADEFIHPLMALDENSSALLLPEIDPEFGYVTDSWMPMPSPESCGENIDMWCQELKKIFVLPPENEFNIREYLLPLLAAKVVVSGKLHNAPESFKVLPDNLRPVRFRGHIITAVLLSVLLLIMLGWRFMLTYGEDIREYRKVTAQISSLKKKNTEMKRSIKRNSKELKEMTRLVAMNVGEPDAVAEFALLSETLPGDVLVSSIRWSEADIDIVMQCENSQLDLPALIQPLKYWKVGSLQQRQTGDSAVATINLKLVPFDARGAK